MRRKKVSPGSKYTRGWESIGHYLSMLKSSIKLNIIISIFLGMLFGSIWFYIVIEKDAGSNIPQYVKASVLETLSSTKKADYDLGEGYKKYSSGEAYQRLYRGVYRGRSIGFVVKQYAFKVLFFVTLFLFLTAFLISRHGRKMTEDERRRGAVIKSVEEERKKSRRRILFNSAAIGVVIGSLFFCEMLNDSGRKSLGNYFWSSVYGSFSPAAWIASPDDGVRIAWYDTPAPGFRDSVKVRDWLRENAFNGRSMFELFLFWLLEVLLSGAFAGAAIVYFRSRKKTKGELTLAKVPLRKGAECYHLLFSGSPGSGKSTAIKEILDQVRKRGQRAVVFDPSGEYLEPYYREGTDAILNPLDARSKRWTLWSEIEEKTDYQTIAKSLFPSGGKDPFWNEAGASLFSAVAEKMAEDGPTNKKFYELLTTGTIEKLADYVEGTTASKFLDDKAGSMPSNLIATMTTKVGAWDFLQEPARGEDFSVRRFIQEEKNDKWLFLTMRQNQAAVLRPLVSLWCDLAGTAILSLPPSRNRRIWFVLDEVAALQRLPALPPLLERGRKHGAAVIIGLQSMPQLRDAYGRDAAAAIASQPQTWLVLRTVEPDTAKWLEQALGETEIDEMRESISMGAASIRDGVSLQQGVAKKAIAMSTEIMCLPDLEGYLKLPGNDPVYRVSLEIRDRKPIAPIFIPNA